MKIRSVVEGRANVACPFVGVPRTPSFRLRVDTFIFSMVLCAWIPPHTSSHVPNRSERYHAIIRGEHGIVGFVARVGLCVLSVPYRIGVGIRNRLFDNGHRKVHKLAVPVISIGNITLGGTGKTPCVEYVARWCADHGKQVAILSRGYGSKSGPNDEAMVLEENLPDVPHLQGIDRIAIGTTAIEELEAELLVLDDGFQHRRLHRQCNIVLIDATCPLPTLRMFPRGTLREPIHQLRRASAIVITRCDVAGVVAAREQRAWLSQRFPGKSIALAEHAPTELIGVDSTMPFEELCGKTVAAFCGIGNPDSFRRTLESLGTTPTASRVFPDHHAYTRSDVEDLAKWASEQPAGTQIVTTQKDWVKLRVADLGGKPLWALKIAFRIVEGEAALHELLQTVLESCDLSEPPTTLSE